MITIRSPFVQAQVYFILFAGLAIAALQNITVDDSVSVGSVVPTYLPSPTNWNQGNTCSGCIAQPDPYYAYNGTWHDATYFQNSTVTNAFEFTFVGSALWIYFILANNITGASTFTSVNFILDGVQVSTFTREPSTNSDYEYNQVVYANDSIPDGQHTMKVTPAAEDVLMLFDYLIYTTDADSTTTTTTTSYATFGGSTSIPSGTPTTSSATSSATSSGLSTGDIIGIAAAGMGTIALATASLLCYWGRKRRAVQRPRLASYYNLASKYEGIPSPAESGTRRSNTSSLPETLPALDPPSAATPSSGWSSAHLNSAESVGLLGEEVDRLSRIEHLD